MASNNHSMAVLCLSNSETTATVNQCPLVDEAVHVHTVEEALKTLRTKRFHVLVAGLGSHPASQLLNRPDKRTSDSKNLYRSRLLEDAYSYFPSMMRIVFSYTVCKSARLTRSCFQCGADAVLSTSHELEKALRTFFSSPNISLKKDTSSHDALGGARVSSISVHQRRARENQLMSLAGERETLRTQKINKVTRRLDEQVKQTVSSFSGNTEPRIPTCEEDSGSPYPERQTSTKEKIRVVHVSDTHDRHWQLSHQLPDGNLFIHTGDIVGNYNMNTNLLHGFQNFLTWIATVVCPKYDKVVLLAGNHDVLLDEQSPRFEHQAREVLNNFLRQHSPKVTYLENSGITYRGWKLYGCPICVCRRETINKWYMSHGFERTRDDRKTIWSGIPEDVDILLTHAPPEGLNGMDHVTGGGCEILTGKVYNDSRYRKPFLHAFGHCHKSFGILRHQNTILSNGSQASLLDKDPIGSTPLVVDLFP